MRPRRSAVMSRCRFYCGQIRFVQNRRTQCEEISAFFALFFEMSEKASIEKGLWGREKAGMRPGKRTSTYNSLSAGLKQANESVGTDHDLTSFRQFLFAQEFLRCKAEKTRNKRRLQGSRRCKHALKLCLSRSDSCEKDLRWEVIRFH